MILAAAAVTVFHYSTAVDRTAFHTLYRDLYFLIILTASFFGGLKTGLWTAGLITAAYAPHVAMTWHAQPGVNIGNLLQMVLFLTSAAVVGILSDREKKRLQELHQAWNLASLGRAALALSSEIHELLSLTRQTLRREDLTQPGRRNLQRIMEKLSVLEQSLTHFNPDALSQERQFLCPDGVFQRAQQHLNQAAAPHGVHLDLHLQAGEALVYASRSDLLWLAHQLVRNAAEVSPPGTTISLATRADDRGFHMIVRDQGPGIPEENLEKIFTPFFSTKHGGTGLGLSVCRKIVSDHEGALRVESRLGAGTAFHVWLPLAFGEKKDPHASGADRKGGESA
ncbi:ATP-binding protein [Desulfacinum hydrothermale]|uniref:ATP-binding protein n=1 Tax=Desulfacinum hydrothermale TaxID=109258 RepID=UPI00148296F3|nr:ATP-binding protein [Desulfacinum hydrothermale]